MSRKKIMKNGEGSRNRSSNHTPFWRERWTAWNIVLRQDVYFIIDIIEHITMCAKFFYFLLVLYFLFDVFCFFAGVLGGFCWGGLFLFFYTPRITCLLQFSKYLITTIHSSCGIDVLCVEVLIGGKLERRCHVACIYIYIYISPHRRTY